MGQFAFDCLSLILCCCLFRFRTAMYVELTASSSSTHSSWRKWQNASRFPKAYQILAGLLTLMRRNISFRDTQIRDCLNELANDEAFEGGARYTPEGISLQARQVGAPFLHRVLALCTATPRRHQQVTPEIQFAPEFGSRSLTIIVGIPSWNHFAKTTSTILEANYEVRWCSQKMSTPAS